MSGSVKTCVDWLSINSFSWTSYCAFMSGRLIALDKQPGVCLVGVGETWRCLFANILIMVTGLESTMVCQYDQLCAGLKAGIYGVVNGVQAVWDENLTTDDW